MKNDVEVNGSVSDDNPIPRLNEIKDRTVKVVETTFTLNSRVNRIVNSIVGSSEEKSPSDIKEVALNDYCGSMDGFLKQLELNIASINNSLSRL